MNLTINYDDTSLAKIARMNGWHLTKSPYLMSAMLGSLDDLQTNADGLMQSEFKTYSGDLTSHFGQTATYPNDDTIQGTLFNDSPYAWRREEGYSGMTDALVRFFANDPGIHYMANSLTQNINNIQQRFGDAVQSALDDL